MLMIQMLDDVRKLTVSFC